MCGGGGGTTVRVVQLFREVGVGVETETETESETRRGARNTLEIYSLVCAFRFNYHHEPTYQTLPP